MTTLHALRRQHALSFSEMARLTGVPVRRLAAFEYHGAPLSLDERRSVAAFFGVPQTLIQSGIVAERAAESPALGSRPQMLATLAAATTIALSLRLVPAPTPAITAQSILPIAGMSQLIHASVATHSAATTTHESSAVGDPVAPVTHSAPRTTHSVSIAPPPAAEHAVEPMRAQLRPPVASDESSRAAAASAATPPRRSERVIPPVARPVEPVESPVIAASVDLSQAVVDQPAPETIIDEPAPTPESAPSPSGRMGTVAKNVPAPVAAPAPDGGAPSHSGVPDRCPLVSPNGRVVITQQYDVGTHTPAHTWGALDLAVASGPTQGATVIATHAGTVRVVLNSWPGGNYVAVTGDAGWRTAYAHLRDVFVHDGQFVAAGTPLGTAGSTGQSTGPHLHYETWRDGVNVNPAPVLNCN
jgi:murein DD-endopeptidase MepM/ murein hydrolase activator NlpD/transcriptional regulator with XRE-family HTH domain